MLISKHAGKGRASEWGSGLEGQGEASSLGANLSLCFDASTGCLRLPCACHAQWKESKPDLARGQRQYVMGFLGVECAAPGAKLILCTGNQPKQNRSPLHQAIKVAVEMWCENIQVKRVDEGL